MGIIQELRDLGIEGILPFEGLRIEKPPGSKLEL